jgi:hypothetical protein
MSRLKKLNKGAVHCKLQRIQSDSRCSVFNRRVGNGGDGGGLGVYPLIVNRLLGGIGVQSGRH